MTDTNRPPLSPAAQAVLDAFLGDAENTGLQMDDLRENVAAALRAAADHLPSSAMYPSCDWGYGWRTGISDAKQKLLAIAAELEDHL